MSKHVLYVEADRGLREVLTLALEMAGYTVTAVDNGFAALAASITEPQPDVHVVGDLNPHPDTSLALVNDLRTVMHRPLIMISTHALPADRILGLASGADEYLVKPFSVSTLVETINRLADSAVA